MFKSPVYPTVLPNKYRLIIGFIRICLIAVIAASFAAGTVAVAQTSKKGDALNSRKKTLAPKTTRFIASNWGVNCQPRTDSKKLACVLSQSIVMAKTGKVFVTVSIRPTSANALAQPYMAVVRLPHGLALAAGVEYQIDKQKSSKLVLYTSSAQGVFARLDLTKKLLSSLRKSKQLKIIFSARNGRKITLSMSMQGFAAGFEKLR